MITKNKIEELENHYGCKIKEGYLLIMKQEHLDLIQEKIGYKFNEQYLLVQAFTRSSFSREHYQWYEDNEKLEFIGDKALDLIVIKKLTELYGSFFMDISLDKNIPDGEHVSGDDLMLLKKLKFALSEGEMTERKKQVIQTSFLSKVIEALELEKYLIMGNGDIKNNVQNEPSVKEDLFEAIIGAIAIDSSWNIPVLEAVIEKMLNLSYYLQNGVEDGVDYITYVQNWHQKRYGTAPEYSFYESDTEGMFKCVLKFNIHCKESSFYGVGYSKKEASRLAAQRAYKYLKQLEDDKKSILDQIGDFNLENAVDKLQVLQDKKIITGLEYIFREEAPTEAHNGNPNWLCQCKVDGVKHFIENGAATKKLAKKVSAFEMLCYLTDGYVALPPVLFGDQNIEDVWWKDLGNITIKGEDNND